eukprot:TRINITY_DN3445_c0_g1_i3.p1 TRINITY_DN3445_c0_g1~~TRINITY_DN3445_c0_g1_i3.p1  ORF type:complete len:294 (-),score=28.64 TRINITY_DN3445_c0_g1_i3:96-977(-)
MLSLVVLSARLMSLDPPDPLAKVLGSLAQEFSCPLCLELLYVPTTLRCGHTFCLECVHRSLDAQSCCPVCREHVHLVGSLAPNFLLHNFLKTHFASLYQERKVESELVEDWVPLFVLNTTLLPEEFLTLHVYEPRYRLMGDHDVGTLVTIISSRPFDDGRFLLRVKGERVFRVEERQILDDYAVGRVSWLESEPADEELAPIIEQLKIESPSSVDVTKAPPDPENFVNWFAAQIALSPEQKQSLLELNTLPEKAQKLLEFSKAANTGWGGLYIPRNWIFVFLIYVLSYIFENL